MTKPIPLQRAAAKVSPTEELANRGLYSGRGLADYSRREFLPQLRGRKAALVYREMALNDGIVGGILFGITGVVRSIEWRLEPAEDTGRKGEDVAEFVESCMADMSQTWGDLISDALTMLEQGYAFLEVVYKQRVGPDQTDGAKRSDYTDGRYGWRKFVRVPQDTIIDWLLDETGGVQAAVQQTPGGAGGIVTIPIDKAVMFRTDRSSPWGRSILRTAYVPWYYRKRIQEVEGIGVDRDLAGLPVIYLDPAILANASRRQEYQDIVRNVRRDEQEGVLLPAVYDESGNQLVKLELLASGGSRQFNTSEIIARYTREIAMSVLQDVLLLGHEKVGTQALAREKRDLSDTAIQAWIDEIANVFNRHTIPKLLTLNGIDLKLRPTLVPGDIRDDDAGKFAEMLRTLSQAGFSLAGDPKLEKWVRERFGLPEPSEEMKPPAPAPPKPAAEGDDGTPPAPGQPADAGAGTAEDQIPNPQQPPVAKGGRRRRIVRDADGLITDIVEEDA